MDNEKLRAMLPDREFSTYEDLNSQEANRQDALTENHERQAQKAVQAQKRAAKQTINKYRKAAAQPPITATPTSAAAPTVEEYQNAKQALETLDMVQDLQANPLRPESITQKAVTHGVSVKPKDLQTALDLQGASRKEMALLMKSLNINTNVQLSKADTKNIVACLLTCNETQLKALQSNRKVPVVIKIIIKRLLDDAQIGAIDTVEKLWDRIFGKQGLIQSLPDGTVQTEQGLIPNVPVSREAYILIRDTLIS